MALSSTHANATQCARVYKLCKVCNLRGKKGQPMVMCFSCQKHVHLTKNCSVSLSTNNNVIENNIIDNKKNIGTYNNIQVICTLCKAKRKSANLTPSTTPSNTSRRSGQSNIVISRGAHSSQVTTPSCALIHTTNTTVRSTGRGKSLTSAENKYICKIPSHTDFQQNLDKLNRGLEELKILCANNNTQVNFLKAENKRLTELVYNLQAKLDSTKISTSLTQDFSAGITGQSSSTHTNKLYNNIYSHNTCINNKVNSNNLNLKINSNNLNSNDIAITNNNNSLTCQLINTNYFSNTSHSNINNDINFKVNSSNLSKFNNNIKSYTLDYRENIPVGGQLSASSPPSPASHPSIYVPIERREVFIPGFMVINSIMNLECVAFSILKYLLPSLNQSDICGVRFTSRTSSVIPDLASVPKYPSFIITLKSSETVNMLMIAKKSCNYFSTKDINLSLLNPEVASALPDKKIFINEVLSPSNQLQYLSVKEAAKSLGFKFVWHSAGRFLARWREGMRVHEVQSVNDLYAILQTYKYPNTDQNLLNHSPRQNAISPLIELN